MEILEYLKSWKGKYVSMVEVCRCAGGRRKFQEQPHWAKPLMARLVDEKLVQVNDRGHYRSTAGDASQAVEEPTAAAPSKDGVVDENYFPSLTQSVPKPQRWIAPEIERILKSSGKKGGGKHKQ